MSENKLRSCDFPIHFIQIWFQLDIYYFSDSTHPKPILPVPSRSLQAHILFQAYPDEHHPKHMLLPFTPLTAGQYPIFSHLPSFIVNYEVSFYETISSPLKPQLCARGRYVSFVLPVLSLAV